MNKNLVVAFFVLAAIASALAALAQTVPPDRVNYLAVIEDAAGNPLSGAHNIIFRFYSGETMGDEILVDSHTSAAGGAVTLTGGLCDLALGSGAVWDGSGPGVYISLSEVFRVFDTVWMAVQVDGETLSPRTRISSAAYALNADSLDGQHALAFAGANHTQDASTITSGTFPAARGGTGLASPGASGNVLTSTGTGWISAPPAGTGDADAVVGNEVLDVANGTLIRSGTGTAADPYQLALNLGSSNTWAGAQTFGSAQVTGTLKDAAGGAGTSGQFLKSTGTGTAWSDVSGSADADWIVSGNDQYSAVSGNVGIGTSSPEFKLSLDGDGGILAVGGTSTGATLATSGGGVRLIWYPRKAAFRAGIVSGSQWDDANIGFFSAALGESTTANGVDATAMGLFSTASGAYSTAIGYDTTADSSASTAMGYSTTASGFSSTAMGISTVASGFSSTAMGQSTIAVGDYSTAMAYGTNAQAYCSVALGSNNIAAGSPNSWVATDPIFVIGNSEWGNPPSNALTVLKNGSTGVLTESPTAALDVNGTIRIRGGSPGAGEVLTSDASGNGTWEAPPTAAAAGAVVGAADTTLSLSGAGTEADPYKLGLNLGSANAWAGAQTFGSAQVTGTLKDATGAAGTTGQLLQSTGTGIVWANGPGSDGDTVTGNEVIDAADATLVRSGAGSAADPYRLALNLGNPNTWAGGQTFATAQVAGALRDGAGSAGTPGQILQSTGTATVWAAPSGGDADAVIGNEVLDAANATLTRSGSGTAGAPYNLALNLANPNTWTGTGIQTFAGDTNFPSGKWRSNGQVGIGTSNPQATLDVQGTVRMFGSWESKPIASAVNVNITAPTDGIAIGYITTSQTVNWSIQTPSGTKRQTFQTLEETDCFVTPVKKGDTWTIAADDAVHIVTSMSAVWWLPLGHAARAEEESLPPIGPPAELAAQPTPSDLVPVCEPVEMGDILAIDAAHPGLLCLSREADEGGIVGIATSSMVTTGDAVSEGSPMENSLVRVATSGIARCRADASFGAIAAKDLLVASPTPGHAMRADNPRPGTVIGKALEPLEAGTSIIKVLVMLR